MSIHILLGMGTGGMEEWGRHGGGGIDVDWRTGRDDGHLILSNGHIVRRLGQEAKRWRVSFAAMKFYGLDWMDLTRRKRTRWEGDVDLLRAEQL